MPQRDQLRSFLSAVRRRWFAHESLRVVGRAAASASVPGLLALFTYWLFNPQGIPLVLLAAAASLCAAAVATLWVWRMQRRPDDRQVARFVEERAAAMPEGAAFDDALVTAVDARAASEPSFGPLLVAAAVQRLQSISPADIVPADMVRRGAMQAAAGLLILAATIALGVAPLGRAVQTAWLTFFPEAIRVEVVPGDARIVAGQPVRIRASVRAGGRVLSSLTPVLTVSAGSSQRAVAMAADGDGFAFPFESVDRTFRYSVTAGAATSREYTVTALFPPRVERIDLSYRYPAFTGLRPRDDEDTGDIYAPAGTRVRVRIHTDKRVVSGEMSFDGGGAKALAASGDRVLEAELVLAHDDSYRVKLADGDGLLAHGDTEYFIRLMDDRPPDVRILRPAADQQITPLEEVAIEARADDDHGISALELVYSVPGRQPHAVPFANVTAAGSSKLGAHLLAAEDLRVKPGDVITYYARARDIGRGKRPTETRSDMYFLEVRPFGEEFVAAQSQAGAGGAASARIETLIAAQKEIINATWNIERRSGAGRSSKDVEAIALAQAELKARAEQISSRRGRGRFDAPQQVLPGQPPPSGTNSSQGVATAVAAMGRAVEQLQGQRTKDALTHEMAALQALLQAQAEIRRREVAFQQATGASSGGRAGEDLSALFDKELQRQQSTKYEARSQVEERPDQQDRDGALDKIRDLARRQEELSRRQRELADGVLAAEERKRQLERLTREQTELQKQVDELARQRQSEAGDRTRSQEQTDTKQARGGQPTQGAGRGNPLRNASEQMRSAAADLGREDASSAAERSARAAEQLRRAEQQMRGDTPEARLRAAGELQLEAQQIVEEQRRIASEAARLDKADPAASADARRRLAGEKDRLADRTDALQRSATALAKQPGEAGEGPAGTSEQVREAAQALEKQQLGRRMRDTAKQMREGTTPRTADAEEQIAGALDRIVEQLGGGSAETRWLAGQLEQTRGIRDRLDRLERQIAEAEARQAAGRSGSANAGGREGREGNASGSAQAELERLRKEYARELRQARETLDGMQRSAPRSGAAGTTPERHEWSQADPGTQGYKQDFAGWQSLRKDVNLALERTEAAASARLARQMAADRLSAGGSDRMPDAYDRLIARYYEALARGKK